MKIDTIFRRVIAAIGATLVLGKPNNFEIETERNDQNNTLRRRAAPADNHTTSHFAELFDLDNANTSLLNDYDKDDWIIPVSHWGCTPWADLGDVLVRTAIEAMVKWGESPWHWIESKHIHYELIEEDNGASYICNCKYCCHDRVPRAEMYEFYERLKINCGAGMGGWIFSKEWDKGYAIITAEAIINKRTKTNLCPPNCSIM